MAQPLVPDELWEIVQPLLPAPKHRRFRYPGRQRVGDREALAGILFVLKTGIPWEDLPVEMGCGCGMTCWRRLHDWNEAGVWTRLHQVLLDKIQGGQENDWTAAAAIPPIAAGPASNSPPSWTATASRWPWTPRPPTYPKSRNCCPWWTALNRLPADRADPGGGRRTYMGTAPTTPSRTARHYAGAASTRTWPNGTQSMAAGWGYIAGWWNASSPGCMASASCVSSPRRPRKCHSPSSTSPPPLFAIASYRLHFVSASKR